MKRYPHIATLVIRTETSEGGSGLTGSSESTIEIQGRYEPQSQRKSLDYSAKFFCKEKLPYSPFEIEGQTLTYEGKEFSIVQFFPFQKHCVLWLE